MESSKACLFAALCVFLIVSSFVCSSDSASCCTRYTKKKLSCLQVKNYSIQTIHGSCDLYAIIFHVNGRFVCADPAKPWTGRAVKCHILLLVKETETVEASRRENGFRKTVLSLGLLK
uniref:C-C motif chemokine n=1 Tax=Xiphophorus couchianus TaxID=32473 RepID=A0A3B5MLH2_9TELE